MSSSLLIATHPGLKPTTSRSARLQTTLRQSKSCVQQMTRAASGGCLNIIVPFQPCQLTLITLTLSRSTVAPQFFLQRNRRFRNQLPAVSAEIRRPFLAIPTLPFDSPLQNKKTWEDILFIASFLVLSSHETLVKGNRCFLGGGIVETYP